MTAVTVLVVLTLAPTSAALAQSAGDDQYADPLAGGDQPREQTPQSQGGGGGPNPGAPTPAPAPAPTPSPAPAVPPAATTDAAGGTLSESQATLPRTGADAALLAATGLALLALGALGLALSRAPRRSRG